MTSFISPAAETDRPDDVFGASALGPIELDFPFNIQLGLGHIVADGEEWADAIDTEAA